MKKCLIIQNPNSGEANSSEFMGILKEKLKEKFDQVELKQTEKAGDGKKFAENACKDKIHSLVVVGGDGSFNEVINGLAEREYRPKVLLLPGGTNNTYVGLLGGINNLKEAIENINLNKTKLVDIGKCNDLYFSYYACFGKMIDATTNTTSKEKEKLGSMAYFKNILKTLPKDQEYNINIQTDSENYNGKASLVYLMIRDKVGNLDISNEDSHIDDGKIAAFILTNNKTISKIEALKDMIFGNLDQNESIKSFVASKISIEDKDNKNIDVDLDGEIGPKLPCKIEILKKHIEIYMP